MSSELDRDLAQLLEEAKQRTSVDKIWARKSSHFESKLTGMKALRLGGAYSPLFVGGTASEGEGWGNADWPAVAGGTRIPFAKILYVDLIPDAPEMRILDQWVPVLETAAKSKTNFVVVTPRFESSVLLSMLIVNRVHNKLNCAALKRGELTEEAVVFLKQCADSALLSVKSASSSSKGSKQGESSSVFGEVWLRAEESVAIPGVSGGIPEHLLEEITVLEVGGKSLPDIRDRMQLVSKVISGWR
ncbi:MAG TPA: hypothetical protein V6C89_18280 [Drouetiella sp.]|jgi:hypothetical protein